MKEKRLKLSGKTRVIPLNKDGLAEYDDSVDMLIWKQEGRTTGPVFVRTDGVTTNIGWMTREAAKQLAEDKDLPFGEV